MPTGAHSGANLDVARGPEAPRHLVLVVIDTLRADHVGPGGYARDTTPHLDALAARGVTFRDAVTHSPRTRTAMGALLTGLYPSTSGLTQQELSGPGSVLVPGVTTLAEHLRDAGFATRGVVSNVNVDPTFGFAQGFERYTALAPERSGENASWLRQTTAQVTEKALEELERFAESEAEERPLFLYLHYLDPHSPYEPPADHQRPFRPESYLTGRKAGLSLSRYDGEIRHVDAALGQVLERLDALGLGDDTALVVTSDHGEEFNDHGGWNHGETHYDEVLRVPLVLALPGVSGGERVDAQVRLIDLVPTILDLYALPATGPMSGRSLLPLLEGREDPPRPHLAEAGNTPLVTYRSPPWKLTLDLETDGAALFDLARDPLERHDVARDHPEVVAKLRKALTELRAAAEEAGSAIDRDGGDGPQTTEDQLKLMQALGYVEDDR